LNTADATWSLPVWDSVADGWQSAIVARIHGLPVRLDFVSYDAGLLVAVSVKGQRVHAYAENARDPYAIERAKRCAEECAKRAAAESR
jgi:hypothetical protein